MFGFKLSFVDSESVFVIPIRRHSNCKNSQGGLNTLLTKNILNKIFRLYLVLHCVQMFDGLVVSWVMNSRVKDVHIGLNNIPFSCGFKLLNREYILVVNTGSAPRNDDSLTVGCILSDLVVAEDDVSWSINVSFTQSLNCLFVVIGIQNCILNQVLKWRVVFRNLKLKIGPDFLFSA